MKAKDTSLNGQKIILISEDELKQVVLEAVKEGLSSYQYSNDQTNNDDVLTFNQARELLDISNSTLHKWKRERIFPFYRIGGRIYFKRSDVDNKLNNSILRDV